VADLLTELRRAAKRVGKRDTRGCTGCGEKLLAAMGTAARARVAYAPPEPTRGVHAVC